LEAIPPPPGLQQQRAGAYPALDADVT